MEKKCLEPVEESLSSLNVDKMALIINCFSRNKVPLLMLTKILKR